VATLRLFVGTTARVLGLSEEIIDDLKIAVSEAATAIVAKGQQDLVIVEIQTWRDAVQVSVAPLTAVDLERDDPRPADIITALFPDTRIDAGTDRLVIPIVGAAKR
jgi:hypothetical protein